MFDGFKLIGCELTFTGLC